MNAESRTLIQDFLKKCLASGFFVFTINAKDYLLETEKDILTILEAIKSAPRHVQEYRTRQAERYKDCVTL